MSWPRVQIRHCARFAYGDSLAADDRSDGEVNVYGSNGAVGRHDRPNTGGPVIVVGRKGSYGKLQYSDEPVFAIDTTYYVDRSTTDTNLRWLYYALSTASLDSLGQDVGVPGLNREKAYSQRVPFPPLATQRAIADYLDTETARINALITKKRHLIKLLEERMLAMATRSVVRPNSSKPTPIPSIPYVPESWKVLRNKVFMKETSEASETGKEEMLSVSHITGVTPRSEKNVNMFEADSTVGYPLVRPGDLVINTMWAWMGAAGVSRNTGLVSPAYGVYRIDPAIAEPAWIDLLIRTEPYVVEMTRFSRGVTSSRLRLYPDDFLRLYAPIPPRSEQLAMVKAFRDYSSSAHALVQEVERQLELLAEHRQALITAAVTGELEVPGVVA